jgi:hypothetical protein
MVSPFLKGSCRCTNGRSRLRAITSVSNTADYGPATAGGLRNGDASPVALYHPDTSNGQTSYLQTYLYPTSSE